MKKFLLSILCCLMAVVNGYAEEVTKSVTFSNYTAGTQYAVNEKHDLGNGLVIYTTECHFTSELRIYSSSSNNGFVVSDALPGAITQMTFNAGYKADALQVYGSNDGNTWTLVGEVSVTSSYKDYSLDFTGKGNYSRFKLDVKGSNQVRLKTMSVTYTTGGSVEPPKETVAKPVISPASTTFSKGESVSVSITTETEGATIHYTINGDEPTAESAVYSTPLKVTETTTVKAIAVKDGWNNSEVAEVKYTMVDPNAVETTGTISFANDTQRVSQDGNSQVWKNDNITFTNNKSSSQNAVVSNVNPVRLYANSEISIEAPGNITKIEFDCNTPAYATALNNSIANGATASSDKVTVTLDGTSSSFTVQKLSAQVRLDALTVTYIDGGTTITPTLNSPIFSSGSCLFVNQIEVSITAEEGATVYYTLDGSNPTTGSATYNGVITLTETTTVKAFAVKDGYKDSEVVEATYTKRVLQEGQIEDYLTVDLIGETGNSYTSWKDKKSNSAAVYAGQSISNIDNIQLRSDKDKNNNYSGIVTTASRGKVKKVIVEWNSLTTDNTRELNVYCSNNPYSTPNDLYAEDTDGDLIGSIKRSGATELSIDGDYKYVGLRSKNGAMYINSITIIWEVIDTLNISAAGYATFTSDLNYIIPAGVEGGIVTVEGTTANVNYVYTEGDIVPAGTGLLMKGAQDEYKQDEYKMYATTQEATEVYAANLLKGALTNDVITAPTGSLLYIFANDSESGLGFYWQKNSNNGQQVQNMAGKAYLQVPTTSAVKGFRLNLGDTTGITAVESTLGNAPVYTLSGVRVNGSLNNLPAGIYIVGGKKVYVK